MSFEEVKKDYIELVDGVGVPNDMTGAFGDSEKMENVIRNPIKLNAKEYMISVIEYGFQGGDYWETEFDGKIGIDNNDIVRRMYEKYIL